MTSTTTTRTPDAASKCMHRLTDQPAYLPERTDDQWPDRPAASSRPGRMLLLLLAIILALGGTMFLQQGVHRRSWAWTSPVARR